jgi:hypothetical protein
VLPNVSTIQAKNYGSAFIQSTDPDQTINYENTEARVIDMIMMQINQHLITIQGHQNLITCSLKKELNVFVNAVPLLQNKK